MDWAEGLPVEILAAIFERLRSKEHIAVLGGVCRGWRAVLHGAAMRHRVILDLRFADINSTITKYTKEAIESTSAAFVSFGSRFSSTRALVLPEFPTAVTDSAIVALAQACSNLRFVDLRGNRALGDASAEAMGRHCQALRFFACDANELTDNGFVALLKGCKDLERAHFNWFFQATDNAMKAMPDRPALKSLRMFSADQLTDAGIKALCKKCPGMVAIDLSQCTKLTNESAFAASRTWGAQLRYVNFAESKLTDEGLISLSKSCTKLEDVDFSSCFTVTDLGVVALASVCFDMRAIAFNRCPNVTDASVFVIARNCSKLERAEFSHCQVSDVAVIAVLARCANLRFLCQ